MTSDVLVKFLLMAIGVMVVVIIMTTAVPNAKEQAIQKLFE